MAAETLNCPMCGASASTDSSKCEHCGARLATIACPACFGMMFIGARFCSHCGAAARRLEKDVSELNCPRCRVSLHAALIGDTELLECPTCEGLWADSVALGRIQNDRERQAAVLGSAGPLPLAGGVTELNVRYIPCPECNQLMNRINFARCSNVIVDVCRPHGTWLDKDELRRIVEFIRAGGLDRSRQKEMAELEEQRRQVAAARTAAASEANAYGRNYDPRSGGVSLVVELLRGFLR
jgi:Zn-finger nucleic acid-binding protein